MSQRIETWNAKWATVVALAVALTLAPLAVSAEVDTDLDAFIASLEGGWYGEDNVTPFGKMGFVVLFERQEDGSLHSRSSLNRETYIDLHFSKDDSGRWILREEAGMEGTGAQAHRLVPTRGEAGMRRWVHEETPQYLTIDVAVEEQTMLMTVLLRGKEHVRFKLDRLPEEELPELKRQLALAAQQSPEEGQSIFDVVENPPTPNADEAGGAGPVDTNEPIATARRDLAASPDDAQAHLALARVLGEAINSDPANGPRYAFDMLAALKRSIELDPHLTEAYHWLVGYYLNAPPIAGGSVEAAEETARKLAEFDPEGGETLLAQVAAQRSVAD